MVYTKLINSAFEAGISDAWGFWRMTPAEVKGRIKAHEMAQKRAVEDADVLAWLIGSYVAHGFHDPKHYPKKPNVVAQAKPLPKGTMDDDDIKDALTVFAQAHNAAEKGKIHGNYT